MKALKVIAGEQTWSVDHGNSLEWLRSLPPECVNAVVTSPPFYALRSYLPADHPDKPKEICLEESPDRFIERLMQVFVEVKRVMRSDALL